MKLLFLGDFYYDYDSKPNDIERICDFIKENDLNVILNLEGSLSNRGEKIGKRGPNLACSTSTIDVLKDLRPLVVAMANNHMMDYCGDGLIESIRLLDAAEIKHLGAGTNLAEAENELIIEYEGQKIAFINCGWDVEETVYATGSSAGCAPLDRKRIVEKIRKLRSDDSSIKIVALFHWGFEYNTLPMPVDIKFAHECIDAGCDLIIGSHPHVMQPMETYKGKKIFYSLGNFYFGSRRGTFSKEFPLEKELLYCGLGAGVILNTEDWSVEVINIKYDYDNVVSEIVIRDPLLDISDINWHKHSYKKKVKMHAQKHNPILSGNEFWDKVRIVVLNMEYYAYSKYKKLRKR